MYFDLKKPCHNCPFLRKGGVRLTLARVREIAGYLLDSQGATFACHKTTVDNDGEMVETRDTRHCAGALIFMEKNGNVTQMVRIAERLGLYDAKMLMEDRAAVRSVFRDLPEMIKVNKKANLG